MNQNQCVPNWVLEDVGPAIQLPSLPPPPPVSRSLTSHSTGHDISMKDYELAELAWENGHLTMHGLGVPRVPNKNNQGSACPNQKPPANGGGTLESIVNHATYKLQATLALPGACEFDCDDDLVPLLNPKPIQVPSSLHTPVSMAMDAPVPNNTIAPDMGTSKGGVGCSTRVGSCSAAGFGGTGYSDWSVSMSGSHDTWHRTKRAAEETSEQLRSMSNNEITTTSLGTSLGYSNMTVTFDDRDHDSICHGLPEDELNNKKRIPSSAKKSRTAAIHNQSERERRDKINQRMKTLQKLVPNSNKTDKASMLDEVIDYLKQLQSQVQLFNTMRSPSMMMPLAMQQQLLQMSMMTPMGMAGMGMGMGMGLGMNMDQMNMNLGPAKIPGIPPAALNPAAYMSFAASANVGDRVTPPQPPSMVQADPLSMYLASQSQSMTMDAYNKVAAMCHQLQQQQQSLNQGTGNKWIRKT